MTYLRGMLCARFLGVLDLVIQEFPNQGIGLEGFFAPLVALLEIFILGSNRGREDNSEQLQIAFHKILCVAAPKAHPHRNRPIEVLALLL